MSAAAGAGIYFEERRGLLTSLWLLLQAQVGTGRVATLGSWAAGQQAGAGRAAGLHRLLCCCSGAARCGLCAVAATPCALPASKRCPHRPALTTSHPTAPSAQVMSGDSLPPELYAVICAFNADLLSQSVGGRTLLVQRLVELVRVRAAQQCGGVGSLRRHACGILLSVYNHT